jgi:hypothetical protein
LDFVNRIRRCESKGFQSLEQLYFVSIARRIVSAIMKSFLPALLCVLAIAAAQGRSIQQTDPVAPAPAPDATANETLAPAPAPNTTANGTFASSIEAANRAANVTFMTALLDAWGELVPMHATLPACAGGYAVHALVGHTKLQPVTLQQACSNTSSSSSRTGAMQCFHVNQPHAQQTAMHNAAVAKCVKQCDRFPFRNQVSG